MQEQKINISELVKNFESNIEGKLNTFQENVKSLVQSEVKKELSKNTEALSSQWKKDLIDFIKSRDKNATLKIETKAINILPGVYPTDQIPATTIGVVGLNYQPNYIQNFLNSMTLNVRYIDAHFISNLSPQALTVVGEGAYKTEASFTRSVVTYEAFKIAGHIPVTMEQLKYLDDLENIIESLLRYIINVGLHNELISRILTTTVVFNPFLYANTILNANLYDLIQLMKLDYYQNGQAPTNNPNLIVVPRQLFEQLGVLKDTTGNYLAVRTMLNQNNDIVQNRFNTPAMVLDRTHIHLFLDRSISIRWGYINDDFVRNIERVVFEISALIAFTSPVVGVTSFNPASDISIISQ